VPCDNAAQAPFADNFFTQTGTRRVRKVCHRHDRWR
jgi:hypothetical protein